MSPKCKNIKHSILKIAKLNHFGRRTHIYIYEKYGINVTNYDVKIILTYNTNHGFFVALHGACSH